MSAASPAISSRERPISRGKLSIFFGAAPGVGKTYAMLEAARLELEREKRDVVVGYIDTHGRYETAALVLGLPLLPRKQIQSSGGAYEQFDLDRALERRPELLLVDELAHTNAEGSRHAKRWQDIDELLDAGIDVYSTLNVEQLESLKDVVSQITGTSSGETIPDAVFESASEVRLIDLPPDELLGRLQEGKVYIPPSARTRIPELFHKGNLIALRELSLLRTAERVDTQMRLWKTKHGIERTWPTTERVLVCVSPSPSSARLVRAARRMAASLRASWIAAYVETPSSLRVSAAARRRLLGTLRLAQELGAETLTLRGDNAASMALRLARERNVTKIVVGKPTHSRFRDLLRPSFLDQIVRASGDIDVYVISGDGAQASVADEKPLLRSRSGYLAAMLMPVAGALVGWLCFGRNELPDVVMILLLGIVLVSVRFGQGPAIVAALLSVLCFDFLFIPPYLTLRISEYRHALTFAIMLLVAIVISGLTDRISARANDARERENRTASLYALSRELSRTASLEALLAAATDRLAQAFASRVTILVPDAQGELAAPVAHEASYALDPREHLAAEWVFAHDRAAGLGTDTLPESRALYLPLQPGAAKIGVVGILPRDPQRFAIPEQRQLLDAFVAQVAAALERERLRSDARRAELQIEAEQLKNSLLSSVSHDLRTPLAIITGSATTLAEHGLDEATQCDLLETIQEESQRLSRLVQNLLDMTRLQAGAVRLNKDWQALEEVVGSALSRLDERLQNRPLTTSLPADLPMIPLDPVLMEQVFVNLLENAIRYTPEGSPIDVSARPIAGGIEVCIADRGPGIAPEDAERVFERFYRKSDFAGGVGLGLPICRGIIVAHGGRLWTEPRPGGGAMFRFTLPGAGEPPPTEPEAEAEASPGGHDA